YRLTLVAQGYGIDPDDEGVIAVHTMSAVVQLLPTALGSQPNKWSTMQQYTLFQTHQDSFELNLPYRIEGPVRAQSQLRIAKDYPSDDDPRERFFSDLRLMYLAGRGDYRSFTGSVDLRVSY